MSALNHSHAHLRREDAGPHAADIAALDALRMRCALTTADIQREKAISAISRELERMGLGDRALELLRELHRLIEARPPEFVAALQVARHP